MGWGLIIWSILSAPRKSLDYVLHEGCGGLEIRIFQVPFLMRVEVGYWFPTSSSHIRFVPYRGFAPWELQGTIKFSENYRDYIPEFDSASYNLVPLLILTVTKGCSWPPIRRKIRRLGVSLADVVPASLLVRLFVTTMRSQHIKSCCITAIFIKPKAAIQGVAFEILDRKAKMSSRVGYGLSDFLTRLQGYGSWREWEMQWDSNNY